MMNNIKVKKVFQFWDFEQRKKSKEFIKHIKRLINTQTDIYLFSVFGDNLDLKGRIE